MIKPILLLLLLSITPLSSAFGEEYYEYNANAFLTFNPTICILESDMGDFSKYESIAIQSMTDWASSLETYTQSYDSWSIYYLTIPFEERENVIPSECYVLLVFYDDISNDEVHGITIKLETGHELIKIYNNGLTTEQLTTITSHELGHILGLGHYVTDDEELIEQWNLENNAPSIMIEYSTLNGIEKITELDLEMMVSLYGNDGFDGLPHIDPEWIKNIYKWNKEGAIEHQELMNALDYLVQNGIIQIV